MFSKADKINAPIINRSQPGGGTSFFCKADEENYAGEHSQSAFFSSPFQAKLTVSRPDDPQEKEQTPIPTFAAQDVIEQNTRHFANCEGVSVQGHTDANYGNSFTAPGTSAPGKGCADCSGEECVTSTGTIISVFTANPQITLPDVPDGLNECEQEAVQNFINGKLTAHEKQHVAAFNKYAGTVKTPYIYKGCASGLDAYTQAKHDAIESARKIKSDAASAALDKNGANIFKITCKCPDPEPET